MADVDYINGINRSVSPLYEAIRDIMAGTWPEDEYDVAASPLSFTDFRSQVSLDAEVSAMPIPVTRNRTSASTVETDFESLKSDESESEWEAEEGEGDDTMNTNIDISPKDTTRRTSIVEGGAAGIPVEIVDECKVRPRRNTIVDEFAEGFRLEIAQELSNLVQEEDDEGELVQPPQHPLRASIDTTNSTNNSLPPVPEGAPIEVRQEHLRLTIPPNNAVIPPSEPSPSPPPIPSRSPSRPNTALAGHNIFLEAMASTTSLQPLRQTVSALSSSQRSSRFFEDLATTTATSMEVKREEAGNLEQEEVKEKVEPSKEKVQEKLAAPKTVEPEIKRKRRSSFSCGLKLWGRGKKEKKTPGAGDNARPASAPTAKR